MNELTPTQPWSHPEQSSNAGVPKGFRRLNWNEVVRLGDFVVDEHRGLELWEGPAGFQADSFLKPTYRKQEHHPTGAAKLH